MRMTPASRKRPAAARNLNPFPVSPAGNAGAGGFPPRRLRRLPPQEGFAPLCIPLRKRDQGDETRQPLGTFYFAGIRNFLFCVDTCSVSSAELAVVVLIFTPCPDPIYIVKSLIPDSRSWCT